MKKFIIFFIIMVSIMTFCLTCSNKINEENVVTDVELNEYRNSLIVGSEKYGYQLTDEELNQRVQEYKETQINIAKSKVKGRDIKQSFKISLIFCSVFCLISCLIFHLKNAQYNEIFGSSFGSDNLNDTSRYNSNDTINNSFNDNINDNINENLKKLRRFFFGRWF